MGITKIHSANTKVCARWVRQWSRISRVASANNNAQTATAEPVKLAKMPVDASEAGSSLMLATAALRLSTIASLLKINGAAKSAAMIPGNSQRHTRLR